MSEPENPKTDPKTDPKKTARSVEAILLSSGRPVAARTLASSIGASAEAVERALAGLSEKYSPERSGIVLERVAGGLRFATSADCRLAVESFRKDARPSPLSGAAHEVLSCVLYLGPTTRAQISSVRGVNSDAVVRNLLERNLLTEKRRENANANATATSATELDLSEDFFIASGATSREDFPPLEDLVSETDLDRVRKRILPPTEGAS